jgi:2-haloacid dehalogenase
LPARNAGFKTAYVTFEEINGCEQIFGTPDVTEDGLAKAAKSIVDQS